MRGFKSDHCPATDWFHDEAVEKATDLDVLRFLRQARKKGVPTFTQQYLYSVYFSENMPTADTCQPFNLIESVTPSHPVRSGLAFDLHFLRLQVTVHCLSQEFGPALLTMGRHFKFALAMCHDWDVYQSGALEASKFFTPSLNPRFGATAFEWFEGAPATDGDPISVWSPLWESRGFMEPNTDYYHNETKYHPAQYDSVPPPGVVTSQPAPTVEEHRTRSSVYTANIVVPLRCRHRLRTSTFSHRAGSWTNFPVLFWSVNSLSAETIDIRVPRLDVQAELHYTLAQ